MAETLSTGNPEKRIILGKYEIDVNTKMGEGASCYVCPASYIKDHKDYNSKTKFAIKCMKKARKVYRQMYKAEVDLLSQLKHPNILEYVESDNTHPETLYIVTKLCVGGELFDRIVNPAYKMTERKVARIVRQMLDALAYIHSLDIVHRDLKPENFLFQDTTEEAKLILIDFGTAVVVKDDEERFDIVGTPFYLAPETASKQTSRTGLMMKCSDVWAVGVIAYICMTGCPPFHGKSNNDICNAIVKKPLLFPKIELSKEFTSFCKMTMQKRWNKRITLADALMHPWIVKESWEGGSQKIGLDAIRSLRQFGTQMKIKKAVSRVLATNLGEAPKAKVTAHFKSLDKDGDGCLGLNEIEQLMIDMGYSEGVAKSEAHAMFTMADRNNDGKIELDEFQQIWVRKLLSVNHKYVGAVFGVLDVDKDGFLTADELVQSLKGLGEDAVKEMIAECDLDGDGKISKKEFRKAMIEATASNKVDPRRLAYAKIQADDLADAPVETPAELEVVATADDGTTVTTS